MEVVRDVIQACHQFQRGDDTGATDEEVAEVENFYRRVKKDAKDAGIALENKEILTDPPIVFFVRAIAESMNIDRRKSPMKLTSK